MFINQSFVAIVFRLINFFAFVGLVSFVYKKYFKADMLFLIAQQEVDHQNLFTQQTILENKQRNLDLLLKKEALECQDFRSKVDEWKKVVIIEKEQQEKEYNTLLAMAKKRTAEVFLKKEHQLVQNNIINAVIVDLEKSLSDNFKDSKQGTEYLNSIMHFMNEKTS